MACFTVRGSAKVDFHTKELTDELHSIITFLPISILAGFLYVAHKIVTKQHGQTFDWLELLAGWLLAASVAWACVWFLQSIGIDSEMAGPVSAIFGASGEKGYSLMLTKFHGIMGIKGKDNDYE